MHYWEKYKYQNRKNHEWPSKVKEKKRLIIPSRKFAMLNQLWSTICCCVFLKCIMFNHHVSSNHCLLVIYWISFGKFNFSSFPILLAFLLISVAESYFPTLTLLYDPFFMLFMGFSRQKYWSVLPFPASVDHIFVRTWNDRLVQNWERNI